MKNLFAATIAFVCAVSCTVTPPSPTIPIGDWTISHMAAGRGDAEITTLESDLLRVTYHSPDRQPIQLIAPKPIALPDNIKTLHLWFARVQGDFTLQFDILDATGAPHALKVKTSRLPHGAPVGWVQSRAREWSMWNQAESWRINVPASVDERTLPEFKAATEALVWPRPLSLAGITITPANTPGYDALGAGADVKAGAGSLLIGEIGIHTRNRLDSDWTWDFAGRSRWGRDDAPRLFLDDLTLADGNIRYEVVIRRGYQGPVVWLKRGEGVVDRSRPDRLFAQQITLPELPAGRYFVDTKTWNAKGTFDDERQFLELRVNQNKHAPEPGPQAGEADFHWSSNQPNHVFPQTSTEATVRIDLSPSLRSRISKDAYVHVQIVDYNNRQILRENFSLQDEVLVKIPVEPGMEYFATARLLNAGHTLDRAHLHFGVESAPEPIVTGKVPDEVPDRDTSLVGNIHYNAEYWFGDRPSRVFPWVTDTDSEAYELFLQQAARAGAKSVSIGDLWGNHEMLPGVYQWHELDRRIARASHYGLKTFLAYTADGGEGRKFTFPLWLDAAQRLDQTGDSPSYGFGPSWWDPAAREGSLRYYRRLVAHVRENPNVIGYRISNYELSGKTTGWGFDPFRLDYSAPARSEFARWIAGRKKTAATDDMRMGTLFSLPGVTEKDLPGPDLSSAFQNFVDFNTYSLHTRLADFFAAIRSLDPKRQIQVDQKPFPYAIERSIPLLRDGGVLKNEDSPTFSAAMLRSMAVQAGVPYAEELHNHMPTSRSIADATNFWHSYLSDHLFWLIRWHTGMIVKTEPSPPKGGGFSQNTPEAMLDYLNNSIPAWQEWIRAKEYQPEVLVFGSRAQSLFGNWRTGGDYDIEGLRAFSALFEWHQVPPHFADEYTEWVKLDRFKTIFVCGETMPLRSMERLVDHARRGGKLVLVGNPGRYCPEKPLERDVLRHMLEGVPGAEVREIAEPGRQSAPGIPEWQAAFAFPEKELESILTWAGVSRRIFVAAGPQTDATAGTRFECQLRMSADGTRAYVAAMRKWTGNYHENIEFEGALEKKYGRAPATVQVAGLPDGAWHLEKFHREQKDMGVVEASHGEVRFDTAPSLAGEVQLFRLTKLEPPAVQPTEQ